MNQTQLINKIVNQVYGSYCPDEVAMRDVVKAIKLALQTKKYV